MSRSLDIYIDGASKGNPGPAGTGVIVCEQGEVVENIAQYIERATNNVAEYSALLSGLRAAVSFKAEAVHIYTDSQLLARQMTGAYKVRNPQIARLYLQAKELVRQFKTFHISHIPREENRGADKLATQAVRQALKEKKLQSSSRQLHAEDI
jgi:ribonuclease HI